VGTDSAGNGAITGAGIAGTINYQTGAISVMYAVDPAPGVNVIVAWTSGVANNNVEIDIWGHALLEAIGVGAVAPPLGQ
jgi:hypothetical protein